tara:strand:+ start:1965 stop:2321 length:357 start_codon:yes stop_codon:yes gene_type:complete
MTEMLNKGDTIEESKSMGNMIEESKSMGDIIKELKHIQGGIIEELNHIQEKIGGITTIIMEHMMVKDGSTINERNDGVLYPDEIADGVLHSQEADRQAGSRKIKKKRKLQKCRTHKKH